MSLLVLGFSIWLTFKLVIHNFYDSFFIISQNIFVLIINIINNFSLYFVLFYIISFNILANWFSTQQHCQNLITDVRVTTSTPTVIAIIILRDDVFGNHAVCQRICKLIFSHFWYFETALLNQNGFLFIYVYMWACIILQSNKTFR